MISPAAPPPPRTRPTVWIVVVCVLGVLVLALAASTIVLATGNDKAGESAAASATSACELIDQVPDDGFEMLSGDDEPSPHMSRLAAAETLALLARDQDGDYKPLYETLREPRGVASQEFDATSDEFVDALASARDACAEEGL